MVLVFPIKRRIWDEIDLEMYAWGRLERRGIINNELLMIASKKREGMLQQLQIKHVVALESDWLFIHWTKTGSNNLLHTAPCCIKLRLKHVFFSL